MIKQSASGRWTESRLTFDFICCGMICDHRFCKICIKTIQIKAINDSAVCRDDRRNDLFYQLEAENLSNYGKLFEQAFI